MNKKLTENIILKYNLNQKLKFLKVTANFSRQLEFSSKEILAKELEDILPEFYNDFHLNLIQEFIKNNKLIIKSKEVFFIGKESFCVNYKMNCVSLITLNE